MTNRMRPKKFETPLMVAMLELSGQAHVAVKFDRIYNAVLSAMSLSEMDYGIQESANAPWVRRWFISATKNKQRHGHLFHPARGCWALTEDGLAFARSLTQTAPVPIVPAPTATDAAVQAQAKIVSAEVVADPVVAEPALVVETFEPPVLTLVQPESVVEPFDPSTLGVGKSIDYDVDRNALVDIDPYLLSVMVEQTNCFGAFSSRSKTCRDCPLLAACKRQVIIDMAELAESFERNRAKYEDLDRQSAQNEDFSEGAAAPTAAAPVSTSSDEARTDQFLENLVEALTPTALNERIKKRRTTQVAQPTANVQCISAVLELVCENCTKPISVGSDCHWIEGTGAFHTVCSASHPA